MNGGIAYKKSKYACYRESTETYEGAGITTPLSRHYNLNDVDILSIFSIVWFSVCFKIQSIHKQFFKTTALYQGNFPCHGNTPLF